MIVITPCLGLVRTGWRVPRGRTLLHSGYQHDARRRWMTSPSVCVRACVILSLVLSYPLSFLPSFSFFPSFTSLSLLPAPLYPPLLLHPYRIVLRQQSCYMDHVERVPARSRWLYRWHQIRENNRRARQTQTTVRNIYSFINATIHP